MPNKEPGAIRQLFAFVGESNGKMRSSILLAVLGEIFGIVPFLMVALLADELYHGTATPQSVLFFSGIAAICQIMENTQSLSTIFTILQWSGGVNAGFGMQRHEPSCLLLFWVHCQ